MKSLMISLFLVLVLGPAEVSVVPSRSDASLELYGTFHAMGITVTVADTDDPNGDAVATVAYRKENDLYRAGFSLSRIDTTRFVGSLFWLEPGTDYDVRVTFADPDGGLLGETVLQATASTRPEVQVTPANNTYIVSPNGSGTACSSAQPCALKEGIRRAQAGDEVVLRGGVYYQGEIALSRSGALGAPIVLRGDGAAEAVLDGADPAPRRWTSIGDGVYYTETGGQMTNLVAADGERLYPYPNLSALQGLNWNLPGYYLTETRLYVHLAGGKSPAQAVMVVSRYNRGFDVTADRIYFVNLTFRHYGQASEGRAIYFQDASENLVQDSVFVINNGGITVRGESSRNVIQDNVFHDSIFEWPWDAVKEAGYLERGGVYFGGPSGGRGNVIRRNVFHDDFDGFDVCPGNPPAEKTNETDVYENLVYDTGDDGLQVDGWCSNVRIWNNTFHDVLVGISFAPTIGGPVYAIRNLIYHFGVGNNDQTGRSFKFNSSSDEKSGPIYLLHNTVDTAVSDFGIMISSGGSNGWNLLYARNNIWSSNYMAVRNDDVDHTVDLDYDNLWNGSNPRLVRWSGEVFATLPSFAEATGQEPNGLNTDPEFVSPEDGVFQLSSTSPLIDAGVVIPGINDDYQGAAPDIGAFESADPQLVRIFLPSTP